MNDGLLAAIRSEQGRPCPRVPLMAANGPAQELITWVLDEKLRTLAPAKLASMQLEEGEETESVLDRLVAGLHHPKVTAILSPKVP